MSVTKFNTIFVYNQNDVDSLDIALQYQNIHDLPLDQLIPINCSSTEILSDYATFQSEVETPILTAMGTLTDIWVIVLGYNVPGGFYDGSDIISATSRLSRINQTYSKKEKNPLYDRKVYREYNYQETGASSLDSNIALICSRIDGPNKSFVENLLFKSKCAYNTNEVNGRFYLDPYSDLVGTLADEYQSSLTTFQTSTLPTLDLEICVTTFIDPYVDSIHSLLVEDSFYWGWFTDRGTSDFFRETDTTRLFFYNADYDGAESIRYPSPQRWPQLALENGYVATAGSMSNPGIDGFLNPTPFFVALREQSTLGEAILFSMPYFNWTISFFGDPLQKIAFPGTYQDILLDRREGEATLREFYNEILFEDLARLVAYGLYRDERFENIRDAIAFSVNIELEYDMLVPAQNAVTTPDYYDLFIERIASTVALYIIEQVIPEVREENILSVNAMTSIEDYLDYYDITISSNLSSYFEIEDTSLLYDQGYWRTEVEIQQQSLEFENFHFELDVSESEDFSVILFSLDSQSDQTGWYLEDEDGFVPITSEGVGSNYYGKKIRYVSQPAEYLDSSELYYFRIRQKSDLSTYSYRIFEDIIWT